MCRRICVDCVASLEPWTVLHTQRTSSFSDIAEATVPSKVRQRAVERPNALGRDIVAGALGAEDPV